MAAKKLSSSFAGSATRGMSEFDREVESRMKRMDIFTDDFSPPGVAEAFPGADYSKRGAPYEKPHDDTVPEADPKFWDKSRLHSAGDPKDQEKMDWLDEHENAFNAPVKKTEDQFPGVPGKPSHNPYDEFPGDVDMEDHKEIAGFDEHLTDPMRMNRMAKSYKGHQIEVKQGPSGWYFTIDGKKSVAQDFGEAMDAEAEAKASIDHGNLSAPKKNLSGPEGFHKEVEKRMMAHLAVKKPGDKTGVEENPKPTKEPKWESGKNPDQEMSGKKK